MYNFPSLLVPVYPYGMHGMFHFLFILFKSILWFVKGDFQIVVSDLVLDRYD